VDEVNSVFIDVKTGAQLPLSDAVEAGLVTAQYENGQEMNGNGATGKTETKTYAVNSVVDQVCNTISQSSSCCDAIFIP